MRGLEHGADDEPQSSPLPFAKVFLDDYRFDCHEEKLKRGGLALTALDGERIGDHPEIWESVVHKLQARFMPPVGRDRPDEATDDLGAEN